ncbi:Putative aliphatic sulfonates transport permease protein SsuC [Arthrobacter sp. 9AX]|uniref:ABC transporter permease n=1 Tax=Arthrobacter sp. 9AX TaxID=2653131 RepID=UPI0012F382E6|nr:ABC transporter permease [Arthrobacter sp. 9AX]VXB03102.1 Putative aliphatic sulfonates transport permease protein SsuC [Arthrobacter sp. 9AX]
MTNAIIEAAPAAMPAAVVGNVQKQSPLRNRFAIQGLSWMSVASVVLGLTAWELISRYVVHNKLFLVGPIDILQRIGTMFTDEDLLHDVIVSGQEFGGGMVLSIVIGIPVGLLVALSPGIRAVLQPWISALYATPTIALSPLFILWFGLDPMGKVLVITLVGVFAVIVNTETGTRETPPDLVEMARIMGLKGFGLFTQVYIRSAFPFILTGIRLAIGKCIIGVVVAELFGAQAGLGLRIQEAQLAFDMAGLFVCVIVLAVTGVLLTAIAQAVENKFAPWRQA